MSHKSVICGTLCPLDSRTWNRLMDLQSLNGGSQVEFELDEFEFQPDLDKEKFIFVGKIEGAFSDGLPVRWILKPSPPSQSQDIQSLFQPVRFLKSLIFCAADITSKIPVVYTTIGTNKFYFEVIKHLPQPWEKGMA